jgi:hypothetical protein
MTFLVPSFHHDIAYLRSEREYTAGCMLILDEAIRILSENPDYYYFVEQAWLLEEYWDARPEKRDLMRKMEASLYTLNLPQEQELEEIVVGVELEEDKQSAPAQE